MRGVTREAEWREAAHEIGEVPIREDGTCRLTQSGLILSFLARKHNVYYGASEDEHHEVLRWLLFDNHKFTSYFASYRFMKAFGATAPHPSVMSWLRGRLDSAFTIVNKHLETRPFMVGGAPTIADFSLCGGYLFYPVEESEYEVETRFRTSTPGCPASKRCLGGHLRMKSCRANASRRSGRRTDALRHDRRRRCMPLMSSVKRQIS